MSELLTAEYQDVTLQLLKQVSVIINEPSVVVQTYGETFQVLEFLAKANAVELTETSPGSKQYKIRKLM